MTATAQPPVGLEVANIDAMELLSDLGYNLGDRDIDFEVGSANGDQGQQDEVLSLQDAGTDGGTQDDLMVDKEDLIEEDEIDYNDLELEDAAGNFPTDLGNVVATTNEPTALVQTEAEELGDDLIDYSDVEDEPGEQNIAAAQKPPTTVHNSPGGSHPDLAEGHDLAPSTLEDSLPGQDNQQNPQGDELYFEDRAEKQPNGGVHAEWQHVENQDASKSDFEEQNDALDNQQMNQDEDNQKDERLSEQGVPQTNETDPVDTIALHSGQGSGAGTEQNIVAESEQRQALHPVTINYDGSELWLFKPRNDEEEGEWLLSEESLATQPFPYLFHACRAQLGDDVSGETELGLRFENFHGLELFEDCTACAYTTIKELLDCYLSLHAQDGNTEPEPFYISLQFRPRVLTLVNELKKAASDRVGFSGFNNAVASGKSSFTPAFSDTHTGPYSEHWDGEEQEEADEGRYDKDDVGDVPQSRGQDSQEGYLDSHHEHEAPPPTVTAESTREQGEPARATPQSSRSCSASHEADEEPADDLIDYSDEEDAADDAQTQANVSSSASSTVQGDEVQHGQNGVGNVTNPTETHDDEKQSNYDYNPSNQDNTQEQASTIGVDLRLEGDDADNIAYPDDQAFDEAFDQHFDPDVAVPGQDLEDYSAYNEDIASYDHHYDGNDHVVDFQEASVTHDSENVEQNGVSAEDGSTGVDDFLDLTGGTEDAPNDDPSAFLNDEDEIGYDDEEDAPEPASAMTSVAVPPTVISPLVQKRPIDEVDFSVEGTSETTDAKRTKL